MDLSTISVFRVKHLSYLIYDSKDNKLLSKLLFSIFKRFDCSEFEVIWKQTMSLNSFSDLTTKTGLFFDFFKFVKGNFTSTISPIL